MTETCSLKLRDGIHLSGKIRRKNSLHWLVAVHGVGEHSGRHDYLKDIFDCNILQYDLRGHGQSEGKRAWIDNFSTFVNDLADILLYLKTEYKMETFALFGHSLGGLIALSYLLHSQRKDIPPEKVFVGAPPLRIGGKLGMIADGIPYPLMKILSSCPLSIPLKVIDHDGLSHDPEIIENFMNDELNSIRLHSRLLLQIATQSKKILKEDLSFDCPVFCAVGSGDKVINGQAVARYFLSRKNAHCRIIEEAYHEMHYEESRFRTPYLDYLKESLG